MTQRTCTIEHCGRQAYAYGLCATHAKRQRVHGDPHHGGPVRGWGRSAEQAFRDNTERRGDCLIWTGPVNEYGYGQIYAGEEAGPAHAYAWKRAHGPVPSGKVVDHAIHCDRACCEASHLRLATKAENSANRSGPDRDAADLPRNVSRRGDRFYVRVTKGGVLRQYGTYDTVAEAAGVAERVRRDLFGEFAGRG